MKEYYSTVEAAKILGISREAVLKQIKTGKLYATKIGRNYAIPNDKIIFRAKEEHKNTELTSEEKIFLDRAVHQTINEYGETLKLLQDN